MREINAYEAISHWQRKLQQIQFAIQEKSAKFFMCVCVFDKKIPSISKRKEVDIGKSNKSLVNSDFCVFWMWKFIVYVVPAIAMDSNPREIIEKSFGINENLRRYLLQIHEHK